MDTDFQNTDEPAGWGRSIALAGEKGQMTEMPYSSGFRHGQTDFAEKVDCLRAWNFIWHMSCDKSRVAKKYNIQSFAPGLITEMPAGLRTAALQFASKGVPPRTHRIYQQRRRLQVQSFPEISQPVKIRHASQKLGSVNAEIPTEIQTEPLQCVP